jgi:hypothetical protein
MEPSKGLLRLNFYQNIHVRLERWEGQTRYYSEEVDRSAFSSPSFMEFPAPAYRQAGIPLGRDRAL